MEQSGLIPVPDPPECKDVMRPDEDDVLNATDESNEADTTPDAMCECEPDEKKSSIC